MEVKYLVYKGNKKSAIVKVTKEPALSAFRTLHVYQGMRLEIGKDIPEVTAKRIMDVTADLFAIETVAVDDFKVFKGQFKKIIKSYQEYFKENAVAVVPALVIEGLFAVMGDQAMNSVLTALRESDEIEMDIPEIKAMVAEVFKLERRKPKPAKKRE